MDKALIKFQVGPVQPFIEGAKTVRDLWTGSYLLSWLVAHAMKPVFDMRGEVVAPDIRDSPLAVFVRDGTLPAERERRTVPTLPNYFVARVPADAAAEIARECENACREAWATIEAAVRETLAGARGLPGGGGWDRLWQRQVGSFFEVRTAALTPDGFAALRQAGRAPGDDWGAQLAALGGLMDAKRSVRHVPDYALPEGEMPALKCSLMGTLERMGPARFPDSKAFWEAAAERLTHRGSRVRKSERLCAVALVKRFALAAHLADRLDIAPEELRYSDTATVAARPWLLNNGLEADVSRRDWSGQWLHANTDDADPDDDAPPDDVAERISRAKRNADGPVPTYYAILMMDGDRLGAMLRGADAETGRLLSARLTRFSLEQVQTIVEKQGFMGELIYAGGDDVLALLPVETALKCASALAAAYKEGWDAKLTAKAAPGISAGLAIVHHKEDLRFALQQAREAEKAAKTGGRDRLAIRLCKRSGEHTTTLVRWERVVEVEDLRKAFAGREGISDRWLYQLRADLGTLQALPESAARGEIERLARRIQLDGLTGEARKQRQEEVVTHILAVYAFCAAEPGRPALSDFVTLGQTASFLARGRDR